MSFESTFAIFHQSLSWQHTKIATKIKVCEPNHQIKEMLAASMMSDAFSALETVLLLTFCSWTQNTDMCQTGRVVNTKHRHTSNWPGQVSHSVHSIFFSSLCQLDDAMMLLWTAWSMTSRDASMSVLFNTCFCAIPTSCQRHCSCPHCCNGWWYQTFKFTLRKFSKLGITQN